MAATNSNAGTWFAVYVNLEEAYMSPQDMQV